MSTPDRVSSPVLEPERRTGGDRRASGEGGRRAGDRSEQFRSIAATVLAFAGGLAILYFVVALIGAVDFRDALVATIVAPLLALVWLLGAFQRYRSGARFVTRRERERRGF